MDNPLGQDGAEVGIITILPECELPAVLRAFGISPESRPDTVEFGVRYWLTTIASGMHSRPVRVVITGVGEAGNPDASAATMALLTRYEPELVCLCGIAAGVPGKVSLGDVVVARGVVGYESEKLLVEVREGRPTHKEPPFATRTDLAHFVAQVPRQEWGVRMGAQLSSLRSGLLPVAWSFQEPGKVHWPAVIASGEKVFGDGSLQDMAALYHDSRILAGEMEGIGFAIAAERKGCPWAVFRGISDYGDPKSKGGRLKDRYHHVASVAAAELARLFLIHDYTGPARRIRTAGATDIFEQAPPLKVSRALITAHDKLGLGALLDFLVSRGVELIATPNTSKHLQALGHSPKLTFEFANCPPISFVRGTLHPYILAAIAADPDNPVQLQELRAHSIGRIELVVANTMELDLSSDMALVNMLDLLEKVQIGGPSLLRWIIRQWRTCAAVVSPSDYPMLIRSLRDSSDMLLPPRIRAHLLARSLQYLADKDQQTARLLDALWPSRFIMEVG